MVGRLLDERFLKILKSNRIYSVRICYNFLVRYCSLLTIASFLLLFISNDVNYVEDCYCHYKINLSWGKYIFVYISVENCKFIICYHYHYFQLKVKGNTVRLRLEFFNFKLSHILTARKSIGVPYLI